MSPYRTAQELPKAPTGVRGLDEITAGGLPRGRATLVCGGAGCGKTLLALEFLVRGAWEMDEPGIFLAFEESVADLVANGASLGFELAQLIDSGRLVLEHAGLQPGTLERNGEFTLDGLLLRLERLIQRVGARRVVLDTLEVLFACLPDERTVRAELHRLCHWLRERGMTVVITAERGAGSLTRHGIEEYVSDCVIVLDHRVSEQLSTRRLRILKYRGSPHGTNEFPFLIDGDGVSVMPITSAALAHPASDERVSSGVAELDRMLGGAGHYRGATTLITGTAGCGKTSLSAHFALAACQRGERCCVFLFEESPAQWLRNMRSVGMDLEPHVDSGLLRFHAARPSLHGLEMHLAVTMGLVTEFDPQCVVVDPISSFDVVGATLDVKTMLVRLVDFLKQRQRTVLMTSLTHGGSSLEATAQEISSIVDTWILLRDVESNGERNRVLHILKSRGMAHSNQVREFTLTSHGVQLTQAYIGNGQVLTGSARLAQTAREAAALAQTRQETERKRLALQNKRLALDSRIQALRAEFEAEAGELQRLIEHDLERAQQTEADREAMAEARRASPADDADDGDDADGTVGEGGTDTQAGSPSTAHPNAAPNTPPTAPTATRP